MPSVSPHMKALNVEVLHCLYLGGWGAMELKTNVSRIRVRFTRQRLRINEL